MVGRQGGVEDEEDQLATRHMWDSLGLTELEEVGPAISDGTAPASTAAWDGAVETAETAIPPRPALVT